MSDVLGVKVYMVDDVCKVYEVSTAYDEYERCIHGV